MPIDPALPETISEGDPSHDTHHEIIHAYLNAGGTLEGLLAAKQALSEKGQAGGYAGLNTAQTFTEDQTIETGNALLVGSRGSIQESASGFTYFSSNAQYVAPNWVRLVADNDASRLLWDVNGDLVYYTNSDAGNTVGSTITWAEKFRITKAGVLSATTMPTKTVRIPHTWAFKGTASTGEMPGFFVSLPTGQTAKIVAARYATESGTVTAQVRKNGSALTDLTALSVSSTAATTDEDPDVSLADGDYIDLNLSSASSPVDLRFTVFVEYTV